jgi:serine palmitoyltransferase
LNEIGNILQHIPGSTIVYKYVKNSYQNDPFRILLELFLVFFAIRYMAQKSYDINIRKIELTEKEIDELVEEWEPEPLVPELSEKQRDLLDHVPVIQGQNGPLVQLTNGKQVLNMASQDYMGLLGNEEIKEKSIKTLRSYGVGACGPPGFYGTLDVHMKLEKDLANYFGTEAGIIYAQGFSTIVSLIPAFSKRGDIIVCDEGVNFSIQRGVDLSRSRIYYYKHHDMNDLERVMKKINEEDRKLRRKLTRRFIVTEGLSQDYGDIVPLPELIRLKKQYKYRLILDESLSVGTLGKTGRGVTEYFDIPASEVDMIAGSMANAFNASGGFCVGSNEIIDHQRLGATAYCFSAALPAILAVSASDAIHIAQTEPERFVQLRKNIEAFLDAFGTCERFVLVGDPISPMKHLRLRDTSIPFDQQQEIMKQIEEKTCEEGVLFRQAHYVVNQTRNLPQPSIRICITAGHTIEQIRNAANTLRKVIDQLEK